MGLGNQLQILLAAKEPACPLLLCVREDTASSDTRLEVFVLGEKVIAVLASMSHDGRPFGPLHYLHILDETKGQSCSWFV